MPRRRGRRMMCAVRRIKGHPVAVALLTLIVASLGLEPMAAVASPIRPGAWYRASGRQPHFSPGAFGLQFRVTPDGRRITLLQPSSIVPVACAPASRTLGPWPASGSAGIQHDGTFRAKLMNIGVGDAAGTTTIVTGRFLSNGRARGTLRYRGPGPYKGCNADGVWTAHAWPLPPPVEHFTGKTDRGTRVTFERTKERHPRVTAFSFGWLTHASGLQCGFEPVRTGGLEPPWHQFVLPVNHGRFSGQYDSIEEFSVRVSGRFDAKHHAAGTVMYGDRGDCNTTNVHWTAHRAG
jgi:hypothetical protein